MISETQFVEQRGIFLVKIKIKESIIVFYIIFSMITIIVFGSLVTISDRAYEPIHDVNKVKDFFDGIWVVFQVMTTVGFGDVQILTYMGRIMIVIMILLSIFSQYLSKIIYDIVVMDSNQLKSYRLLKIEEIKARCVLTSAKVIKHMIRMNNILNHPEKPNAQSALISNYRDMMIYVSQFKMARRGLDFAKLESTTSIDLLRKLQYQVGKIADLRASPNFYKAASLFSKTTKLAVIF